MRRHADTQGTARGVLRLLDYTGSVRSHPDIFPLKNKSFSTKLFLVDSIFEVKRKRSLGNSVC